MRNEAIYAQSCSFFFLYPSLRCLRWLRHYLELLTLFVNIAYNVTLNMQICTAQHLISHLSVKVPSVGSPGGPGLMSWQVLDRNMQEEGEVTRPKETVKEERRGREVKTLTPVCLVTKRWLGLNFSKLIMDRKWKYNKWSVLEIHGWMDREEEQQSSASLYTELS